MNEIVSAVCVSMLCSSLVFLLQSLIRTFKAYKKHKELKNNFAKSKDYEFKKIDEIIATQKEILEILRDIDNTERNKDLTIETEKLEKRKKELEDNYLMILRTTKDKKI
ncbi:hypothetical protein C806_01279 [Lachnospiraceae bacterium 3-1]|nr:hypothetical protein C806_01279 [Lachnospiraceae bacterium 3-1]